MRAIFLALLLPLSAIAQGPSQTTGQQGDASTVRKNVNVVNLFFVVRDPRGALLPNLAKEEFELREGGKPQTIRYFSAETDLPLTLGLLIDSNGTMQRFLSSEKVLAADFLRQVITEKDLGFILSFDISVDLLQDLTSDIRLLSSGLDRARINLGGGSNGIPGLGEGPVPVVHPKADLVYDAVYLAANEVFGQQVGRKALVMLTDGNDLGSRLKLTDAIEAAQKADTICYVLLLHDPQYPAPNFGAMQQLTVATGGRTIELDRPDRIGDAFSQISRELHSQYSLSYSPDNANRDGTFRKIEVRSKNGYRVQARQGYYAPSH